MLVIKVSAMAVNIAATREVLTARLILVVTV